MLLSKLATYSYSLLVRGEHLGNGISAQKHQCSNYQAKENCRRRGGGDKRRMFVSASIRTFLCQADVGDSPGGGWIPCPQLVAHSDVGGYREAEGHLSQQKTTTCIILIEAEHAI